jgi:hypothetical protein
MKRVYILEGPDGGGKTTLGAKLAKAAGAVTINHGPYPEITEPSLWLKYLHSMLPAYVGLHPVILDRAWFAEPIYGAAFRSGKNRILPWQRRILERFALGVGAVVVYCLPPVERCLAAWRSRPEAEYLKKAEQLEEVYAAYAKEARVAFSKQPLASIRYDYTKDDHAVGFLESLGTYEANEGPGVGAWRPGKSIVIIGERPGGTGGPHAPAFCGTDPAGCSAWLSMQLENAGVPEQALYWVNAYAGGRDEAPLDPTFIERLRPPHVFALGEVAVEWARWHGIIDAIQVSHPQSWRRFHHREPYPLIKELTRCLHLS